MSRSSCIGALFHDGRPAPELGCRAMPTTGWFPHNFLFGTASAAHQIEGGNVNADWWAFEHDGTGRCAEVSGDACDSWHRFEQDLDLVAALGLNSYRYSVEWARIEPAPGEFSVAALDHYRRVTEGCLERGLVPVVTLHHFTLPRWMAERGGFESPEIAGRLGAYAARVGAAMGDVIGLACTINEPNIVALMGYLLGVFPPARSRPIAVRRRLAGHARVAPRDGGGAARGTRVLPRRPHALDGRDGGGRRRRAPARRGARAHGGRLPPRRPRRRLHRRADLHAAPLRARRPRRHPRGGPAHEDGLRVPSPGARAHGPSGRGGLVAARRRHRDGHRHRRRHRARGLHRRGGGRRGVVPRRRHRRARHVLLVAARQLRVGARLRPAVRHRRVRPNDVPAPPQAVRRAPRPDRVVGLVPHLSSVPAL